MSKFVKVTEAPENLPSGCFVISAPSFLEEIKSCDKKRPKTGLMTPHYLREIIGTIALKYDSTETFNALTQVNVTHFKGIPFKDLNEVEEILNRAISANCPELFDMYVDYHIKKRPFGTKLIYFLGSHLNTGPFTRNGIDEIQAKEVDTYLGNKPKRKVGKPAITDKQAKAQSVTE